MPSPEFVWNLLLYLVLPLWVLAGFVDYLCHRASDIEHTSGIKETIFHWILLGEMGLPVVAAVLFKINALIIALMIIFLIAHEVTTHFDLRLAIGSRRVSAFEQQVHSLLEILPFTALLLIAVLYPMQALALFGMGAEPADLSIALKPLPPWQDLLIAGGAFLIFGVAPYCDELWRDIMASKICRSHQAQTD